MLCIAVGASLGGPSVGTAAPAKMYLCQSLPACSPHPLSGLERERWGAGGRVQGEAGGRAARLELPDMGTRLTAGSNWLPSESLPLPLPDYQSLHTATFFCACTINKKSGMRQKWGWGAGVCYYCSSAKVQAELHYYDTCTHKTINLMKEIILAGARCMSQKKQKRLKF